MSIWSLISKLLASLKKGDPLSKIFQHLKTPSEKTVGFTIAVIGLSTKMAKADGTVTKDEKIAFKKIFRIPKREEKNLEYVFSLAQQDIAGFEIYAKNS